jgi:tetratricopeptide (TPR) repeat protein
MKRFIEEAESLIRSGQFDQVEKQLLKLGKIERKSALAVANIARRVNRLNMAVRILNPIVRPTDSFQDPATAQEKIEYADALRQVGAVDEAWNLLCEVRETDFPKVLFHKALCLFSQWKYAETLPLLKSYVQVESLSAYERVVGQVNLAAALIQQGQYQEASTLLDHLRIETQKTGALLMYGSTLELASQIAIFQGEFDLALKILEESSEILKRTGRVVSLYVQKWTAIAQSLKQRTPTSELQEVVLKAQAMKHWETVRDCELYQAYLTGNQEKFQRLYFGTPYESFRQRILTFAGKEFRLPENHLASPTQNPTLILDLESGKVSGKEPKKLPLGHAMHRLLILLSRDSFKPLPVMSAFGKLFPEEFMNATTSANRVHQVIKRLREWIADAELPITIEELNGTYKLVLGEDFGIRIPAEPLPMESQELVWNFLKREVGEKPFNVHEASQILNGSPSNAKLLLRWAIAQGKLQKFGQSSQTAYQVIAPLRRAVI